MPDQFSPSIALDFLAENQINQVRATITKRRTATVRPSIRCSADSYRALYNQFDEPELYEQFLVLLMNRRSEVIGVYKHSQGGMSGVVTDAKLIFSVAISAGASAIILAHNHPSGNPNPSQADKAVTSKLIKAGELLDVFVLDHIIVAPDAGYYSFADSGEMI